MGSYSAPAVIIPTEKGIADNTAATDEIIIAPQRIMAPFILVQTSALWDGDIAAEYLDSTGGYTVIENFNQAGRTKTRDFGNLNIADLWQLPITVRFRVATPPTVGLAICYLFGLPVPANPLF